MKKFKVVRSTPSSRGGFVNTVEFSFVTKVFGVDHITRERYCIKTEDAMAEGIEQELDITQWEVVERESVVPLRDAKGEAMANADGEQIMTTIKTKWLQGRKAA